MSPSKQHQDTLPLTPVKLKFDCERQVVLLNELSFCCVIEPVKMVASSHCDRLTAGGQTQTVHEIDKIPEGFHLDASPLTPVKLKFDCEWSVVLDNELSFWFPFESWLFTCSMQQF